MTKQSRSSVSPVVVRRLERLYLGGMLASVKRSRLYRPRWLVVAGTLLAGLIAAIAIADAQSESLTVYLVLGHPTIRTGGSDSVVVVNKSYEPLNTAGVSLTPRTTARFSAHFPHAMMFDDPHNAVPPSSNRRVFEPTWPTYPPGRYWVWVAYAAGSSDATLYAYRKLTIVAR